MNDASPLRTLPPGLFTDEAAMPSTRRVPAIDSTLMHALAVRAMDAGVGGQAAVGLASVLHGEGATTIACSMAACVAATLQQRVVLVDANQRTPALRQVFGIQPGPGLGDVLSGSVPLESALFVPAAGPAGAGRLLVLPASAGQSIPMGQMGSVMAELLAALHGYAELLVFDAAPLQPYPDSTLLARHLDGFVVVLQAERATWDRSEAAVQALRNGGANVLGAVLNRRRSYLPRVLDRML